MWQFKNQCMTEISIIVAVARDYGIGKDNQLLWHISEDLKRFKKITAGHSVIMGRKTWLSLPRRPLPKRRNIVLSRNPNFKDEGAEAFTSIEKVLETVENEEKIFIIGGQKIYEQFLNIAHTLYITRVDEVFEADTFFSEISDDNWENIETSQWFVDEKSSLKYRYEKYRKK